MLNMGPGRVLGGYRVVLPLGTHPACTTPGTPLPTGTPQNRTGTAPRWVRVLYHGLNMAAGLKSVAQLTLSVHFSEFRGITEGYNVVRAGNPDDHKYIPGKE